MIFVSECRESSPLEDARWQFARKWSLWLWLSSWNLSRWRRACLYSNCPYRTYERSPLVSFTRTIRTVTVASMVKQRVIERLKIICITISRRIWPSPRFPFLSWDNQGREPAPYDTHQWPQRTSLPSNNWKPICRMVSHDNKDRITWSQESGCSRSASSTSIRNDRWHLWTIVPSPWWIPTIPTPSDKTCCSSGTASTALMPYRISPPALCHHLMHLKAEITCM